jgi:hypothetical protein
MALLDIDYAAVRSSTWRRRPSVESAIIHRMPENTPAGWLPDPSAKHELRYWDGAQWTDHVANGGVQSEDVYIAAAPPPPPTPNLPTVSTERLPEPTSPEPTAGLGPPVTGEAVSSADVRETEDTLWEGETQNLAAVASKGKVVNARYRLTNHALYTNTGVVGSSEKRVPLGQVTDVSVQQSMLQKRRAVGTLTVRVQPAGAQFPTMTQIDSVPNPHDLRDLILRYSGYERQRASRSERTFYAGN